MRPQTAASGGPHEQPLGKEGTIVSVLDTYERKARLTPGLFGIAPVAFAIATLGLE